MALGQYLLVCISIFELVIGGPKKLLICLTIGMKVKSMPQLLILHIARTGGTTIRRMLKSIPKISSFDLLHNGYILRFRNGYRIDRKILVSDMLDPYRLQ